MTMTQTQIGKPSTRIEGLVPTSTVSTHSDNGPKSHLIVGVSANGTGGRLDTKGRQETMRHAAMKITVAPEEMTRAATTSAVEKITKTTGRRISAAGKTTFLLQVWTKDVPMTWTAAGINIHRTMHQATMVIILTCLHTNVLRNINKSAWTVASHTLCRANATLAVTDLKKI